MNLFCKSFAGLEERRGLTHFAATAILTNDKIFNTKLKLLYSILISCLCKGTCWHDSFDGSKHEENC